MYFWRLERLKTELRHHGVSERAGMGYLLGAMILMTVFINPEFAENEFSMTFNWLVTALSVGIVIVGSAAAYRANGGAGAPMFRVRYFALAWVLGIRLFVFLLAAASIDAPAV